MAQSSVDDTKRKALITMSKTLYLSDLDGTLLRSDIRISAYTAKTIDRLVKEGGCFSYATARSLVTAAKVTEGLDIEFPVICYNGAFIFGNESKNILHSDFFTPDEVRFVSETLTAHGVYPIVFSFTTGEGGIDDIDGFHIPDGSADADSHDGLERFSYIERFATPAIRTFLNSRKGDPRTHEADSVEQLYSGNVFYFAALDTEQSLSPINDIFKDDKRFTCLYQKDIYDETQWCELLPATATKASAAIKLKEMLGCDRIVAFGDGLNDLSMFAVADECYAMANAVPELKAIATAVIGSNDEDGVAKWLEKQLF